jgi:nucleoid-associated protein YgaU
MSQPVILGSTALQPLDPFAPPRGPEIDPAIFERLPVTPAEPFVVPRLRLVVEGENGPARPGSAQVAREARPGQLRLTRRGRVVVVLLVALVLAALSLGLALASSQASASTGSAAGARAASAALAGSSETVVVQPGDTLWSIARQVAPNADPRGVVDAIIAANHLAGASVQAGQQLVLPS